MSGSEFYKQVLEKPANGNRVEFDEKNGYLRIIHGSGVEEIPLLKDGDFRTSDPDAEPGVRSLYKYMDAIGRSKSAMFGQENNVQNKAGDKMDSHADTYDMVQDYPALQAFDVLSFTGVEFSARRHNMLYTNDVPGWKGLPVIDTAGEDPVISDIKAAAALARRLIEMGSVFSLSAHMPNFLFSKIRESYIEGKSPSIAKYNYKEYTPNRCEGDVVREVMPGGKAHDAFKRYLDIIAEFAKLVEKPFFFRPLHENTGSWFWWGADHCTPEEFKDLWHYIADYLREEQGIHNLLYAYSPGSENGSAAEYGERYPGDDYVDMVGVDMYDPYTENGKGEEFFDGFKKQLSILEEFSASHKKLMAVTETGLASNKPDPGCKATSIHLTGNLNNHWHSDVLDLVAASRASYFLLWANFGRHGTYYTPFVDSIDSSGNLIGHETLDDFIRFYNDERVIFSGHQVQALRTI